MQFLTCFTTNEAIFSLTNKYNEQYKFITVAILYTHYKIGHNMSLFLRIIYNCQLSVNCQLFRPRLSVMILDQVHSSNFNLSSLLYYEFLTLPIAHLRKHVELYIAIDGYIVQIHVIMCLDIEHIAWEVQLLCCQCCRALINKLIE